ncbi:MAG: cysteine--tRNA ligase [Chloroflexota bacterium]|nr:cysteine--tRNA ligase [Chloroflexota bacterium]
MRIHNTLSGQKEEFTPAGDPVKMYVCGVTPYSDCHIGHAMSYIIFDTVRRYLKYRGYNVKYVQNFTDIDDKLIARAGESGTTVKELAEGLIAQYFEDMDALNIGRVDIYPRATEEIPKIVEVIGGLIEKGHAYASDGDVYFSVSSFPEYGKLSHRNLDDMMSGAVCEDAGGKKDAMDFTLWKGAKPGEPQWDSPWGPGRPGWHIECSAMSLKYLGETIDIHGGGNDLVFPHHENEIAQSEAFTGKAPFVKYWMHNGLLQLGDEKMSKSLGNLITIREALVRYSPDAIRLFILSSHYRSPLTVTDEGWDAAGKGVERLRQASRREGGDKPSTIDIDIYRKRFIESMDDDFNTAQAVAAVFDLARDINRAAEDGMSIADAQSLLIELCGILGLTLEEKEVQLDAAPFVELAKECGVDIADETRPASHYIDLLMQKRAEARKSKEWALADKIRNSLAGININLEDTPQGTIWRYKR